MYPGAGSDALLATREGSDMISIRYSLSRSLAGMEGTAVVQARHVVADTIEDALAEDARAALRAWGPEEVGDETRFSLDSARHSHLGMETFPCRRRTLRRAGERAWPWVPSLAARSEVEPHKRVAFFLLREGGCVARVSPFFGVMVSRF